MSQSLQKTAVYEEEAAKTEVLLTLHIFRMVEVFDKVNGAHVTLFSIAILTPSGSLKVLQIILHKSAPVVWFPRLHTHTQAMRGK